MANHPSEPTEAMLGDAEGRQLVQAIHDRKSATGPTPRERAGKVSAMVDRLWKARDCAWQRLQPAFNLAIAQAEQAEYEAARSANLSQCSVQPAYPPLVVALAGSVDAE